MQKIFNIFLLSAVLFTFIFMTAVPASANSYNGINFAQVTDLRFSPDKESVENLDRLINSVNSDKSISFVVFSGNNIIKSDVNILTAFLTECKKIKKPFYIEIGNYDCLKSNGLSKEMYLNTVNKYASERQKSFNYVVKKKNFVFVFVDGAKEKIPSANGYYREDTLKWLDKTLSKYSKKDIVIIQHFPVYDISENSYKNLYRADLYKEVLKKHTNVKAVLAGHYQINDEKMIGGIHYITTAPAKTDSSTYGKIIIYGDKKEHDFEIYRQSVKF